MASFYHGTTTHFSEDIGVPGNQRLRTGTPYAQVKGLEGMPIISDQETKENT